MASIRPRGNKFLVTWREGGRGTKQQYRSFPSEQEAIAFKRFIELKPEDRAAVERHERLIELAGDPSQWPEDFVPWLHKAKGTSARAEAISLLAYARQLCSSPDLASGTRRGYRISLGHLGALGSLPLADLKPQALREWWNGLTLGTGARANLHKMLRKVLRQAADDGLVPPNLLRRSGIRTPSKRRTKEIHPLTPAQVNALADACTLPVDQMAVLLGAYGGLRAGEVGGLRVQDFEPATCRVRIRQATFRNGGESGVGEPKTEGSKRTVRLPRQLCETLKAYIAENSTDGRILITSTGGQVDHIYLTRKVQQAAKRAGLPGVNFHMLRHTAVALLIRAGLHPKVIQQFCGHKQLATTMDVYGHLFPQADEDIGSAMEAAWSE